MSSENDYKEKTKKAINNIMDTEDKSKDFNEKEISDGKGMAILSYIIPLIPYFVEKKNKFVIYHAKQGMNLLIITILYTITYNILSSVIKVKTSCGSWFGYDLGNYCKLTPWWVTIPLSIIGLIITIIAIIGLINAANGKAKELPIVNKFKIIK